MTELLCPVCRKAVPYPPGDGHAIRRAIQDAGWVSLAFVYLHARYVYTVCSFTCAANLFAKGPPKLHEQDPGFELPRR